MIPLWYRRPLVVGDRGRDVEAVERLLGLPITGTYSDYTERAVRGAQARLGLPQVGGVDEATALGLGSLAEESDLPDWWKGEPLWEGSPEWGLVLNTRDMDWLRRLQGQHGITPTGVVDEQTARLLGAIGVDA